MESIAEILESELKEAVEVKNEKSLHRYIILLSENIVSKQKHAEGYHSLKSDIKEMLVFIRERFEAVDKRFEAIDRRFETIDKRFETTDKRFESMQNMIDKRFEQVDKRFEEMQSSMDKRFEQVDKRFEQTDKRFSQMFAYFTTGFIIMAALMTVYQIL